MGQCRNGDDEHKTISFAVIAITQSLTRMMHRTASSTWTDYTGLNSSRLLVITSVGEIDFDL